MGFVQLFAAIQLLFLGLTGLNYVWETTANLLGQTGGQPVWTPFFTNPAPADIYHLTNSVYKLNSTRFYRTRRVPYGQVRGIPYPLISKRGMSARGLMTRPSVCFRTGHNGARQGIIAAIVSGQRNIGTPRFQGNFFLRLLNRRPRSAAPRTINAPVPGSGTETYRLSRDQP